jgi:hypothetical protein
MHPTKVVPFLVEDELMRLGATLEKLADPHPQELGASTRLDFVVIQKTARLDESYTPIPLSI